MLSSASFARADERGIPQAARAAQELPVLRLGEHSGDLRLRLAAAHKSMALPGVRKLLRSDSRRRGADPGVSLRYSSASATAPARCSIILTRDAPQRGQACGA